ncbi:MAG: YajQ family cyclic di-GMP-binding protein [Polyangiales bacterium]|nr:YajQ family cyclic di-GMP-binding protein [Myxococcales bacterium]MCB9657226.1 YajQ family cyclic di-GMP-binding protein [Sandaracinaceae bacterium]MCB9662453.1 YajQ family cyclic di-GMP-binding protein [Sandaracinaceae bacterium]
MPTFDVVSELDLQEVKNALDQAQKEVAQRFDFKGTDASVELKDQTIVIRANSENRVAAVLEVLHGKLVKRGVSLLALDAQPIKAVGGGASQQVINLKQGIDKDGAKKVVKALKDSKLKVQPSIQGDVVRVSGKKRDDLQEAIAYLRGQDLEMSLQYKNFRD